MPIFIRASEPRQAILDRLRFLASRPRPHIKANLSTVQFLKARIHSGRQLHIVTFQDQKGQQWDFTFLVTQDEEGAWYVQRSTGEIRTRAKYKQSPNQPQVRLNGGPGTSVATDRPAEYSFLAWGDILNGNDVAVVRLISANGLILEDRVQDGLVLFARDQEVLVPLQAELYNHDGQLISSHPVFQPGYLR